MVKKKQKNEYQYIIGVLVAAVLGAVILGALVAQPLYKSLQKANDELKAKKAVLEKLETNLETLKTLESKKAEIESKNQKVLAALPKDKDVPRLFRQLEKIAGGAGLQISSVSESSATATTTPATTETVTSNTISPVTYQVSGTAKNYASLKTALAKIEEGLRIVSIDKISTQGGESGSNLTVNLTVTTYTRGL